MSSATWLRRALAALLTILVCLPSATGPAAAATSLALPDDPIRIAGSQPAGDPSIAVGPDHACALVGDQVECWGANGDGQLGDGTTIARRTPVRVRVAAGGAPLAGVRSVAAGLRFTCALLASGRIRCWGSGTFGQLGNGSRLGSQTPVTVASISNATALVAGRAHVCAILAGGSLKCWGRNAHGQLGDGTTMNHSLPVAVRGLAGVTSAAAGDAHTCAIRGSDHVVLCWGANGSGQLGLGTRAEHHWPAVVAALTGTADAIAAGARHTCAITEFDSWFFGTVQVLSCWGDNSSGQVALSRAPRYLRPEVNYAAWDLRIVVAGAEHTCTTGGSGTTCWGGDRSGQVGDGTRSRSAPPSRTGLGNVASLAAGGATTCAWETNAAYVAAAWCWGENGAGQVGDGTTLDHASPRTAFAIATDPPAQPLAGGVAIAAGAYSTCAVLADHTVRCWGDNSTGELGDSSADARAVPVRVLRLAGVTALTSGGAYTCATLGTGLVRCWGDNSSGQLGDGTTNPRSSPVLVRGIAAPIAVVAGQIHTCAVLADHTLECWGENSSGQLGDGSLKSRHAPVPVAGLTSVASVALGIDHTCALRTDGTVWCWGDNSVGQLGDGTLDSRLAPARVPGLRGVTALAAQGPTTCALLAGGTVRCWGDNSSGQLANRDVPLSPVPVPIGGITGALQVAVAPDHVCALLGDGHVACWGDNSMGQLGDGTRSARPGPGAVVGLSGATALTAGWGHTCALAGPRRIAKCWGAGDYSQVGNGLPLDVYRPTTVVLP